MSGVTRRTLLGGAATMTGLAVAPAAIARPVATLHVFDSRLGAAPPPARAHHDIALEDATLWRASRDLAPKPGDRVTGITRWSDWVALRGLLNQRGLRTQSLSIAGNIATWEVS